MQIKELFLQGFKSFANPTRIEFVKGLNVVVGPNGSGKSNIIDAVNWLLANPPRFLRTTKSQEVIFQGSSSSPLSMALVEMLVSDYTENEFSLGRRIFVSNTSEYLLNGQPTRYRDFRSELARRGIDSSKTKIMALGQEQLQKFFNSSPEERFHFLKGISGVEEWEEKLTNLCSELEKIKAKFQRLRERAKEVEFQIKQIKPLAEEEKRYLIEFQELQSIKAIYLEKEIAYQKTALQDLVSRQKTIFLEKQALEEEINFSYQQSAIKEKEIETISQKIERINNLREKLLVKKEELERELYIYLARKRETIATALSTRKRLLEVEKEISILEKNLPHFEPIENKTKLLEEIGILQQKLGSHLRALNTTRKRKIRLQEKVTALVSQQKNLDSEFFNSAKKLQTLSEEIARAKSFLEKGCQDILEQSAQISKFKSQKERLLQKLFQLKNLEERVRKRLNIFQEKKEVADHIINLAKKLRSEGFTEESVEAISWLLDKLQTLPLSLLHLQNSEKRGKFFLTPGFVSSFRSESSSKFLPNACFDSFPGANLVTTKGDLIILGGAIGVFPKRIVFQESESKTLITLKKRKEKLQERKRTLEKELQNTENLIEKAEQKLHNQKLHCAKMEEKLNFFQNQETQYQKLTFEREKQKEEASKKLQLKEQRLAELEKLEASLQDRTNQIKKTINRKKQKLQELDHIYATQKDYLLKIERLKEKIELIKKYSESANFNQAVSSNWHSKNSKLQKILTLIKKLKESVEKEQQKQNVLKEELKNLQSKIRSLQEKLQKQERLYNNFLMRKEEIYQKIQELEAERTEINDVNLTNQEIAKIRQQSPEELKSMIRKKEQVISSLSPKQGAIEEMERLLKRQQWLKTQILGFEKLITLAQSEIQKCYAISVHRFEKFMKELQQAFARNFAEIFEGGKARLVLKKSSVETHIKLPGKKERDFILLSSGEKALCSLCFVLALLETAGLPFALLDEADANLDHFNAQKIARLLQSFAQQKQLIVVTHQEEVMEAAQRIIGITMENGISKAIYLKDINSEAHINKSYKHLREE